ncbi:hypothetical protein LRT31_004673 [Salmonella enterica]|nr:hypothetical protein [Salmonella enterica]
MTTIRRRMWAIEEQERQAVLIKWEIDNLIHGDNKPKKADVNHTHKQGEADHRSLA